MMPFSKWQVSEQFQQSIAHLQETNQQAAIDFHPADFKTQLETAQVLWRQHEHNCTEEVSSQVQAVSVEIDKQLRLLAIDALFLQTARQSTTLEHRRQQIGDRLTLLQRYCELLLAEK